jgi:hypothetical protein
MRSNKLIATVTAAAASVAGLAFAGDEMTSLSYISYLERYATVQAAEAKENVDAVVNMPVITGDRIDTARGARVEVQLADGSTVWLDEFTTLDFDALAASRENPAQRTVLFLQEGTAAIEIPATAQGDGTVRFDYPGGTLFLSRPGLYRFDLRSGQLHVETHDGLAELPAGVGSVLLRTGQEAALNGDAGVQKATLAAANDDFWAWVDERRHPAPATRTAEVVGTGSAGRAAVLDSYGTWVYVDAYSNWAWRPYTQTGWTPYNHGRWHWTPVGWNWISYEPWGWYPYHYGSWYLDASFGWLWCWDQVWGPAWVHWLYTPGYIGWCPRGYYDWPYFDRHHRDDHDWSGEPGGPGGHGGSGPRGPGRWGNAYDFSGRVRLHDVDPRPWSMVPSDQFTNSRLDRVRVDPGRVLRGADGDARGLIRSGPLVTRPSRGDVERSLDGSFDDNAGGRSVPDLGRILGRDDQAERETPATTRLRSIRTGDMVSNPPRAAGGGRDGETGTAPVTERNWSRRSGAPIIDTSGTPRQPRSTVGRGAGSAPPVQGGTPGANGSGTGSTDTSRTAPPRGQSPSSETPRSAPAREPSPTSGREPSAPRSREVQPAPSKPAPAQPPPSRRLGYAARVRSYESQITGTGSGAGADGAGRQRGETWVVSTGRGERTVRVYTPESGAAAGSSSVRRSPSRETAQETGGYSPARPPVQEWTRSTPYSVNSRPEASESTRGGGTVSTPRSYQPSPPSGSAPRSYSPPSSSAPRSASPPPASANRSAPSASHSGSSSARPHGRS